jgi:RND family efflux transporter MFP subunit
MQAAKKRWKWLLLGGVACLAVVGWVLCPVLLLARPAKAEETNERGSQPAVVVTVAQATIRPVARDVAAVGTLEGYEEVPIAAKVEGRIARIYHEVGDVVAPGEPLLDLDDLDYRLALTAAQRDLELELARIGLKELPGEVDLTRVPSLQRTKNLVDSARHALDRARRLGRAISAEDQQKAETAYRVAVANDEQAQMDARASVAAARHKHAQVQIARQKLAEARVITPCPSAWRLPPGVSAGAIRYVVAARKVAEGEVVGIVPPTTLFRLVIDRPLKLMLAVPERSSSEVKVGQAVTLEVEAWPGRTFSGTVARINPTVDRVSRTLQVEVSVPNESGELRPGSFVKASIRTRQADRAVTVPEESIVRFGGVVKVFVVEGERARAVVVRTGETITTPGPRPRRWVELLDPLTRNRKQKDIRVVTSGQSQLALDTPVQVRMGQEP